MEHILVDPPILPAQTTIELEIAEPPCVHQPNSVRSHRFEQLHLVYFGDGLDLCGCEGRRLVEVVRFLDDRVQGVEAEERPEDVECGGVNLGSGAWR